MTLHFKTVTTVTVTDAAFFTFLLFYRYSLFLYQAYECLTEFAIHLEGIVVHTQVRAQLRHRLEVQSEAAVVAAQHALIVLADLHAHVRK